MRTLSPIAVPLLLFLGYVLWTELHPTGVACGGASTMCAWTIRNYSEALQLYADEHQGRYPDRLEQLAPGTILQLPECIGTFNGCRVITKFGIISSLESLSEPWPAPPARPEYRRYRDGAGKWQYHLECRRNHGGRYWCDSGVDDEVRMRP